MAKELTKVSSRGGKMNKLLKKDALDQDTYYIDTERVKRSMGRIRISNRSGYRRQLKQAVDSVINACERKRQSGKI